MNNTVPGTSGSNGTLTGCNELTGYPPCPECGRNDSWNDLGCMECGLEFFPPSEAYWAASPMPLGERIADLLAGPDPDPPAALPDTASPIERKFWAAHGELGLPELDGLAWQYPVDRFRLDFALPHARIGIELDGFRNHSKTADIARDHARQRWLGGLRWYIIRFGGAEVHHGAEACVRETASLVRQWAASGQVTT